MCSSGVGWVKVVFGGSVTSRYSGSIITSCTGPRTLPTRAGFDLVCELPDVPVEDEDDVVRLRLEIDAKASKGLFRFVSTQSDSSHLFRVHADRLELSTR